jgi:hypothetical protein
MTTFITITAVESRKMGFRTSKSPKNHTLTYVNNKTRGLYNINYLSI